MYSKLPKAERYSLRGSLAVGWAAVAVSGVGGVWFTGESVSAAAAEPAWLITVASTVTIVAAVLALAGVVLAGKSWWLEWLGAGLAGAGVVYYVLVPWIYVSEGNLGRLQQAGIVTACMAGFIVHRLIACWAHARRLKRQYDAEGMINGRT